MMRMEALQEARGGRQIKFRIAGFDANKKAVRRGMGKAVHIENRMVRLGQPVQGEHAKHCGDRRAENGKLKCNGNEGRPAIERATANVHGVAAHIRPNLEEETAQTPTKSAKQGDRWNEVALQAQRFRKTFDGKGSVGIETAVACLADFLDGMNELFGRPEFAHHTVDMGALRSEERRVGKECR